MGGVAHRHLLFLHGFEERGLRFRRGAVDFIGQEQIGEDRAGLKIEHLLAVAVILHHRRADHIGGHQVGRELNSRILQRDGLRERAHQQRLADARHAFEQHVRARQQRNQHAFDHLALADDRLGDLGTQIHHFP